MERGIAELKQAYAIKPHPDVLYDIAKAYVDLGKIPDALNYFRQYVATDPEDKENVQSVMARLEAAIGGPAQPAVAQPRGADTSTSQKLLAQLQALIAQQQQAQPAPQPSAKGGGGEGDRKPAGAVPAAAVRPAHPEDGHVRGGDHLRQDPRHRPRALPASSPRATSAPKTTCSTSRWSPPAPAAARRSAPPRP